MSLSTFKTKLDTIQKRNHICVRTWNHYDRYNALKAVCAIGIYTVSDDLNCQYYYHKVVCEERLPLSSWKDNPEPLKQICIVDVETAIDSQLITIICKSQVNLLKAFTLCWKLLASDIHIDFNDSQYDWLFIVKKANKLEVLKWIFNHMTFKLVYLEKIIKWEYRYNMIKCKLDNKVDLPIHCINKYYEKVLKEINATTVEQICEITKYYIIDTFSCQRLMVKYNAINEYREVTSIALLLLFDTHYFAEGIKVYNLLSASAWQRGILTSMISSQQTETGKYPRVYVFPPHEFIAEYDFVCFDCSSLDKKQYAFKVYMNTFYGTAKDSKFFFFLRELAGGVTSAG
ncbi:15225_t:CDS:2, partial [Funneliformis geosporum]